MQWSMSSESSDLIHEYHLIGDDNSPRLILKYNTTQQSARIYSDGRQRLIFIEKSGFWNNITVLKNEYGVDIGRFYSDKWNSHSGIIESDGKKYHHNLSSGDNKELIVYEKIKSRPLFTCRLESHLSEPKTSSNSDLPLEQEEYSSLLIGLCWYLFAPSAVPAKEETAVFDLKLSVA